MNDLGLVELFFGGMTFLVALPFMSFTSPVVDEEDSLPSGSGGG